MNRSHIFIIAVLAIFPCCNRLPSSYVDNLGDDIAVTSNIYRLSSNDIYNYAMGKYGESLTKSGDFLVQPILFKRDTVFYLLDYGHGWELLSADKRAPRVIMKCSSDVPNITELVCNETQGRYLSNLAERMYRLHADKSYNPSDSTASSDIGKMVAYETFSEEGLSLRDGRIIKHIDTVYVSEQDHLLQTNWGQGSPWNTYSPYTTPAKTTHCYTGCVPVASAQILYYLHYSLGTPLCSYGYFSATNAFIPAGAPYLILSSSDISVQPASFTNNWSGMKKTLTDAGSAVSVSALMTRLGYLYNAEFRSSSTGALLSDAVSIFPIHFGISASYTNYTTQFNSILYNDIFINRMPVGASVGTENYEYHAIVIDGYRRERHVIEDWERVEVELEEGSMARMWVLLNSESYTEDFVAINWGWNGLGDALDGATIWYNVVDDWYAGGYDFTLKRYLVHNFAVNNNI